MAGLAQTPGLTEGQREIVATVREFVNKEILPYATELERTSSPTTSWMAEVDGAVWPHRRRGVRRPRGVAANLCAGGGADRPRLDASVRSDQHPLHRRVHD